MKKQEVAERITKQLTFELDDALHKDSKELGEDIAKKFLDRQIKHLVNIVLQINQIQKNKGDKKDIPKLQNVDRTVFYLMDIMAIIEPLNKLDLKDLKGNANIGLYDLYSKVTDALSPVPSAEEFANSNIQNIGISATKHLLKSNKDVVPKQLDKSLDDAKNWLLTSGFSWVKYILQNYDAMLKPSVSQSVELAKILDEGTIFGRSEADLSRELQKINEEVNKAQSFLEDLYEPQNDLKNDLKNIKRVLSKLACGLMVVRDEVSSKKQSTLKVEELKNKITDLTNEIVVGDKKYLSPLTRTKIFLKEINPLTELGSSLGLVDYYKNMSTSAKLTSATVFASAGLLLSSIAIPVSFVAFSLSAVGTGVVVTTATLKSAYQSSVVEIKDAAVKVQDISSKVIDFISTTIPRDRVIELSTFSKGEKYYVRDVESFIYYAFLGKSELEKEAFKGFIEDTFIKSLASQKDKNSVKKSLKKLFNDCAKHVGKGDKANINAVISDIYTFMNSINDIVKKSKEKNGILSQSHLQSFIEKPKELFEELRERVNRAKNDSHVHDKVSTVLEDVTIEEIPRKRNRGV